jgi:anaerobic selenocysteine-containing dehydrogenase
LKRGAKLIVIDPRQSDMASKADIWLQIRPGTDCALALAMLNVIVEERLYDKDFVDMWTYGFDRLRKHVKAYSPEKMAEVTWIPADLIRKATRLYVQEKPSSVCFGTAALCQHPNSIQTNRAIGMVVGLTGNLEIPGGNVNYSSPLHTRSFPEMELNPLPPELAKKSLSIDRFRLFELNKTMFAHPRTVWEAVLSGKPYSVKAILLFASNPLLAYGNSSLAREALMEVDFLVSVDYFMNPTAELADIVLPAAHWTERNDIDDLGADGFVFAQPKAVEPLGECWDEKKMLVELAKRLGLKDYWKSAKGMFDYRLELTGITFEQLKQVGRIEKKVEYKGYEKSGKFNTPSGKIELYSESFEKLGLDPIPVHTEPPESPISTPELAKDYPLVLTTGARHIAYYHSGLRNIPSLRKLDPEPTVDINPTTAESLGIKDGDWVLIETPRGGITRKARFFDGIHPKVVHITHGWWYGYEPEWKRVNVNILTDNSCLDPIIGSEPLKCLLCRVRSSPKDSQAA